jgi:hypothetical protein
MAELGSDFNLLTDLDPNLSAVSEETAFLQALCRRLQTPRGGLWYDLDYGTDLRQFVNAQNVQAFAVEQAVEQECLKDERVQTCSATVTRGDDGSLTVSISVEAAEGPFEFTLLVSSLTVELLDSQFPQAT